MSQEKNKFSLWLVIIASLLLTVNCLLIYQNLSLKAQLQKFEPVEVKEGDKFEVFQATDLDGNQKNIEYTGKKQVILFFRTTCGYCKKQMTHWKEMISVINSNVYQVSAVTSEKDAQIIRNYLKEYSAEDWNVLSIKSEAAQKANLTSTPITVVLDNNAKVEKVWTGMWREDEIQEALSYFSTNSIAQK